MMNQDEKFQRIWDFRRRDDGDSSSDDSKSRSGDKNHNIGSYDLVLVDDDDDEVRDAPKCPKNHKNKNVRWRKKKMMKKSVTAVADKSKRCLSVKESKKRTRPKIDSKERVLFEDLKIFADSLIHDLKVAREDMSSRMRQETGSFVSLTPISGPKKAKRCKKKEVQPDRSIKSIVTSDASDYSKAVVNYDKCLDPRSLATNYDRVVSSRSLPQPTVIPKSHLLKKGTQLNDHESLGPDAHIAKTTHGFSALRQEAPFGGFLGQNCSGNVGFRFPVPLHQGLGYSSNTSSQIYENLLEDKSKVNLGRANGGNPAISEYVLANGISSNVHRSDGGFLSLRSQDVKELQLYMASLRNNSK